MLYDTSVYSHTVSSLRSLLSKHPGKLEFCRILFIEPLSMQRNLAHFMFLDDDRHSGCV
jgi:hypothetical protein